MQQVGMEESNVSQSNKNNIQLIASQAVRKTLSKRTCMGSTIFPKIHQVGSRSSVLKLPTLKVRLVRIPSMEPGISKVAYRLTAYVSEGTHPANGNLFYIKT